MRSGLAIRVGAILSVLAVVATASVWAADPASGRPATRTAIPPGAKPAPPAGLAHRWAYVKLNLQVDEHADKAIDIARRAAAAGYNGLVLADYKLNVLDRVSERYFKNIARFKAVCDERHLEIVPCVASFGYSEGIYTYDPNLMEGLPARDMPLRVKAGVARGEGSSHPQLRGQFEEANNNQFTGWSFQDRPGEGTFRDAAVKHGGTSALRLGNPAGQKAAPQLRIMKGIGVRPFTQFHLSAWIKTEGLTNHANLRLFAMGADGRVLSHQNLGVQATQDWTRHDVMFNSLENETLTVYVGVWGETQGTAWVDDLTCVEAPFVNLVRRPGCPLELKTKSGRKLIEGRDYDPIVDQLLLDRLKEGRFDVAHESPVVKLRPSAKLNDGDVVLASYYHAVSVYDGQVPASLSEEKSFEIVRKQVESVKKLLDPRRMFLSHDEIRVANWSATEQAANQTAGQLLAANVRRCEELCREIQPGVSLCIWNDMFDPHHNAKAPPFYLVRGTLEGSWEGLSKETLIINWNQQKADSAKFFADRGHQQVLAGYYDAPVANIRDWLDQTRGMNVTGVMYTTWRDNYADLEAFAKVAWGPASQPAP
jgi:hypothetical protein